MKDNWAGGAIFEFEPEDYIEGVWFIGNDSRDLLGMLWKNRNGKWQARYRWRHHDPATMHKDPFSDNDTKTATDVLFAAVSDEEAVRQAHLAFMALDKALMALEGPTAYYYLPVKGDRKKCYETLMAQPFAFARKVPAH